MNFLVVLLAAFVGVQGILCESALQAEWELFKLKYEKVYASESEDKERFGYFKKNLLKILLHNELYEKGLKTYTMAMNPFGDQSTGEFISLYTMKQGNSLDDNFTWPTSKESLPESVQDFFIFAPPVDLKDVPDLPTTIGWMHVVTPVKDQGACGSCWSFSATGALEAQWSLKTLEHPISLSEQNLIDCAKKNNGCNGGIVPYAYAYIIENKGIDFGKYYPYEEKVGKCRYRKKYRAATLSNVAILEPGEDQLKYAVATVGPISVSIRVIDAFIFYSSGVFYEPECTGKVNHGVLVVGYGTDDKGGDYWLLKNSWSELWGEKGYVRLARNRDDQCSIGKQNCYPIV